MIDEGYIKYESDWTQTAPLDLPEIDELIEWRRPLFASALVGYDDTHQVGYGNISARSSEGFVITGTQTGHLPELGNEHFSLVTGCDVDSNRVTSHGPVEASSEAMTHAVLYEHDPYIRGVVHIHDMEL